MSLRPAAPVASGDRLHTVLAIGHAEAARRQHGSDIGIQLFPSSGGGSTPSPKKGPVPDFPWKGLHSDDIWKLTISTLVPVWNKFNKDPNYSYFGKWYNERTTGRGYMGLKKHKVITVEDTLQSEEGKVWKLTIVIRPRQDDDEEDPYTATYATLSYGDELLIGPDMFVEWGDWTWGLGYPDYVKLVYKVLVEKLTESGYQRSGSSWVPKEFIDELDARHNVPYGTFDRSKPY